MYVLRLHCDDTPGVVAAVATCLSNAQCNIEESSQFNDGLSGQPYKTGHKTTFSEAGTDCKPKQCPFKDPMGCRYLESCLDPMLQAEYYEALNLQQQAA